MIIATVRLMKGVLVSMGPHSLVGEGLGRVFLERNAVKMVVGVSVLAKASQKPRSAMGKMMIAMGRSIITFRLFVLLALLERKVLGSVGRGSALA
tara:strand:- start:19 stop:303 length:285 start_codon:yes stop_codon:yes gene_type:complete